MRYLTGMGPLNPLVFQTHNQEFPIPPSALSSKRFQQLRGFWIDAGLQNICKDTKAFLLSTLDTKLYNQCPELACRRVLLAKREAVLFCGLGQLELAQRRSLEASIQSHYRETAEVLG